jgi:hypothetical protein
MIDSIMTIAGIMVPMEMTNNGWIFLWAVPLIIIIATVYKATKLDRVFNNRFVKDSAVLSLTIMGFMALIAVVLYFFMLIIT